MGTIGLANRGPGCRGFSAVWLNISSIVMDDNLLKYWAQSIALGYTGSTDTEHEHKCNFLKGNI